MRFYRKFLTSIIFASGFVFFTPSYAKDYFPQAHRYDTIEELNKCLNLYHSGTSVALCKPSDKLEENSKQIISLTEIPSLNLKAGWIHNYPIVINRDLNEVYNSVVYLLTDDNKLVFIPHNYFRGILKDTTIEYFANMKPKGVSVSDNDGSLGNSFFSRHETMNDFIGIILKIIKFLFNNATYYLFMILAAMYIYKISKTIMKPTAVRYEKDEMKTFNDIAGHKNIISNLKEIIDLIKTKDKKQKDMIPSGLLFEGPPGNGKTLLACSFAGELNVPFYSVNGSDVLEMYAGLGALRIRNIFSQLRKHTSGAVLFIDEIDALASKRTGGSSGSENEHNQIVAALLNEMDGIRNKKNSNKGRVIVIAATNRSNVLDPAILRPGRLDRTIHVSNPDLKTIQSIMKLYAKKSGLNFANDVDFDVLGRNFIGKNSATISDYIREVKLNAWRKNSDIVTHEILDETVDDVLIGHRRIGDDDINNDTLLMIARHEAGHAFIGMTTEGAHEIRKVTIIPREKAYGYVSFLQQDVSEGGMSRKRMEAQVKIAYAGRASEEVYYGNNNVTIGASQDINQATKILRAMGEQFGMFKSVGMIGMVNEFGQQQFSENFRDVMEKEILKMSKEYYKEVLEKINLNKKIIDKIVDKLLEKKTLMADEVANIIKENGLNIISHNNKK